MARRFETEIRVGSDTYNASVDTSGAVRIQTEGREVGRGGWNGKDLSLDAKGVPDNVTKVLEQALRRAPGRGRG